MNSITIITIVVVALLTALIFGLSWLAYKSLLKEYKLEVDIGKHDSEIFEEYHSKKKDKKKKFRGLVGAISYYLVLIALSGLFITGLVYKINNQTLKFNNETVLVIKSGSMSQFYDEETAAKYNYNTSLQFDVGDICKFNTDSFELVEGEVYGYTYKNIIITHRLISYDAEKGLCKFKGDANYSCDALVPVENVKYHYTGFKIPGVGAFILYAQSYFGLWSVLGIAGTITGSEIVYYKLRKINKERDVKLSKEYAV